MAVVSSRHSNGILFHFHSNSLEIFFSFRISTIWKLSKLVSIRNRSDICCPEICLAVRVSLAKAFYRNDCYLTDKKTSLPIPLASYRPRFIGTSDDHVIIYSRPFGSNKTQSSIKLLTGSNRIELDEPLSSGPGSFEPLYKSPFNKR